MKRYSGKTLEDLLNSVAFEKKCTIDELHYFIIEEKEGFLGIGREVIAEVYCDNDISEFIKSYLSTFFTGLDMDVNIDVHKEGEYYRVLLNADNNAIIIGRNGQSLEAINTVLKGAVSAEFKKRVHLLVDINNYKTDRYDKIKGIAYRVANSVQKSHITATLDPMSSDERRIVHNFLSDMSNIRTESEGDGKDRRIKIIYDPNKN